MKRTLDALREGTFDLLVLGGGITGAGVALDATLRGFRVALIDKGDFASGTSSISSKLVHGGLRYLEHGGFRLVYEALHERKLLLQNAPHIVHPLRFIIPFYRGARVPPWKYRIGLTLYDLLAGESNLERSRPLHRRLLEQTFAGLRHEGLRGGAAYFDAQMDDARLCLEVVKTAALHGAVAANYVEAVAFERQGSAIRGVRARDHVGGADFLIRARQVLNATGPWVDTICRLAGDTRPQHLQPTKGVHLVAPGRGFTAAFLLLHPRDGRVFFVIPWLGKTLIGTTDTHFDDRLEAPTVTTDDVLYLLDGHNHYFIPTLEQRDILSSFVGVRPLIRARPENPSAISREFQIFTSPTGLLSVAGGKYTTYRMMAETITDTIAYRLGRPRRQKTRHFPLDGAPLIAWERFQTGETARLCAHYGIDEPAAHHLVYRYGRHAADVADYIAHDTSLGARATPGEPDLQAEFAYQRDQEMAIYPADHLLRRTRLGLFSPRTVGSIFGAQSATVSTDKDNRMAIGQRRQS